MKNSESRKFEESWEKAFSDAEMNPSEKVWDGIDMHLSKMESGSMKRRVVFYQRLAAASILFALLAGGVGLWNWATKEGQLQQTVAQKRKPIDKEPLVDGNIQKEMTTAINGTSASKLSEENLIQKNSPSSLQEKGNKEKSVEKSKEKYMTPKEEGSRHLLGSNALASLVADKEQNGIANEKNENFRSTHLTRECPTISSEELPVVEIKLTGEPTRTVAQAKRFKEPTVASKNEQKDDRGWWASVGGAAGNYNPNTSVSTNFSQAQLAGVPSSSSTVPNSSEASAGTAFSYGVNLGKKVAKRWVIVTGVNYLNQSIGYNSNVASLDANNRAQAYVADLNANSSNLTTTTPYKINSSNEFLSIPLQAGFILLDKKIGLQLNAGVSSDFFMKNTLIDESGKLASFSQGAGGNSAYRTINWTGLASTEFSYRISNHYRVSVLPGLRYGFNPVLKSGTTFPVIWDVGFRFRYLF
ncbi:MAG: hypothetical protein LW721_14520 [Flammeovirgaceae bacterium]|nr:hypothetical protein [Flammeovirgaceae bacterium]